jgi:hypothetical protein
MHLGNDALENCGWHDCITGCHLPCQADAAKQPRQPSMRVPVDPTSLAHRRGTNEDPGSHPALIFAHLLPPPMIHRHRVPPDKIGPINLGCLRMSTLWLARWKHHDALDLGTLNLLAAPDCNAITAAVDSRIASSCSVWSQTASDGGGGNCPGLGPTDCHGRGPRQTKYINLCTSQASARGHRFSDGETLIALRPTTRCRPCRAVPGRLTGLLAARASPIRIIKHTLDPSTEDHGRRAGPADPGKLPGFDRSLPLVRWASAATYNYRSRSIRYMATPCCPLPSCSRHRSLHRVTFPSPPPPP